MLCIRKHCIYDLNYHVIIGSIDQEMCDWKKTFKIFIEVEEISENECQKQNVAAYLHQFGNIYEEKYLGAFSICKILDFPNAKIAESSISRLK